VTRGADKPAILIASGDWPAAEWAAEVAKLEPDRPVACWPDLPAPKDIRYLLAWSPPRAALKKLTGLEVIFSLGAGVDHLFNGQDLPDVPVVRIINAGLMRRMTEWTTLQVLMHHRRQRAYDRSQARRIWRELAQPIASQVRVGVMGFGELGADTAEVLVRLGFQVAGWSRTERRVAGIEMFHGEGGREAFLRRTDILVCLLPLTAETRGILARPLFDMLARDGALAGPILINAGRGGLQVEDDIDRALTDGTLVGASLDVFETEPLDPASALWQQPNLIITPHCSAYSAPDESIANIHAQILAYEAGQPLRGVVDRGAGY
jgi:glyoxylate/hydroxypyruvate reductase A